MCENDYWRLHKALARQRKKGTIKRILLEEVRFILKRAAVHAIRLIPHNIVTMNSEIALLTGQGKVVNIKLVYPDETDRTKGYVSIFSWTGICLIGKKEGDSVRHNICVHKITYQPEERQDFHL
jgi:transcription elongation GreA/GreB family factor